MTLEWLLILAAVAGLAAGTVLAVQSVLDETTDVPLRPEVQLIDADITAVQLVAEAREAAAAGGMIYGDALDGAFRQGCEAILARFHEVVQSATWTSWDKDTVTLPNCVVIPKQL